MCAYKQLGILFIWLFGLCLIDIIRYSVVSRVTLLHTERGRDRGERERDIVCVCVNVCVCYVLVVCVQTARYLVYLVARPVSHRYHPIVRCLPRHPPTYRESEGGRMHKHSTTLQGCPKMWTLRGARSQIKTMLTYACTHTHTHTNTHTDIYVYLFVCACVCVCLCVCVCDVCVCVCVCVWCVCVYYLPSPLSVLQMRWPYSAHTQTET